ncbi:MAG: metallophosphoesterase family protein [Nitrososphaerota archaeon]
MMVGHISDTHLGAFLGRSEELREVSEDVHASFLEAIDLFVREHVDLVIHSGDILDEPRPYGDAMRVLVEGAKSLRIRGIPLLFTLGEHDISSVPSTPHPLITQLAGLATYVGDGEPHEVGGLTVIGLHKHRRLERDRLVGRLEGLGETARGLEGKKVLVLHQGIRELFGPGSELSLSEVPQGFDYYAMGHIHGHHEVRLGRGLLAYPGPSHWVDVNDPDECGVLLVDLSGDEPEAQWIRLRSVRPKVRVSARAQQLEEVLRGLLEVEHRKKPVLWMEIEGDADLREVERRLADQYVIRRLVSRPLRRQGAELGHEGGLDIDGELRRLALQVIGDEEMVDFALGDLLRLLSTGEPMDAEQALWDFWKRRYGISWGEQQ